MYQNVCVLTQATHLMNRKVCSPMSCHRHNRWVCDTKRMKIIQWGLKLQGVRGSPTSFKLTSAQWISNVCRQLLSSQSSPSIRCQILESSVATQPCVLLGNISYMIEILNYFLSASVSVGKAAILQMLFNRERKTWHLTYYYQPGAETTQFGDWHVCYSHLPVF